MMGKNKRKDNRRDTEFWLKGKGESQDIHAVLQPIETNGKIPKIMLQL